MERVLISLNDLFRERFNFPLENVAKGFNLDRIKGREAQENCSIYESIRINCSKSTVISKEDDITIDSVIELARNETRAWSSGRDNEDENGILESRDDKGIE